jgi:phosphoglycolate phosphatase
MKLFEMTQIFIDLDGTLLINQKRFESILLDISQLKQSDIKDFIGYKRLGLSNIHILSQFYGYDRYALEDFKNKWAEKIEEKQFLMKDLVVKGAREWLRNAPKNTELTICTARRNSDNLLWQLNYLEIAGLFERIVVTYGNPMKHSFISELGLQINNRSWFIGDSVEDIKSGKLLGLKTCAVLTGYTPLHEFENCSPDLILKDITDFDISNLL